MIWICENLYEKNPHNRPKLCNSTHYLWNTDGILLQRLQANGPNLIFIWHWDTAKATSTLTLDIRQSHSFFTTEPKRSWFFVARSTIINNIWSYCLLSLYSYFEFSIFSRVFCVLSAKKHQYMKEGPPLPISTITHRIVTFPITQHQSAAKEY